MDSSGRKQQPTSISTTLGGVDQDSMRAGTGESDEISLNELIIKIRAWWNYLSSKWLTIVLAGILGGLVGLGYTFYKKPIYKAELSFALEDEKAGGGLGGALGLASQFGFDLGGGGGGAFSGDNLLELMKSRTMVEKTLLTVVNINGEKQTLAQLYFKFNKLEKKRLLKDIQYLPGAGRSEFSRDQDSLLGEFHKKIVEDNLSVKKIDKKLTIISVGVTSNHELFSKNFAEVLVKEVSDFYVDTKTKRSSQNVAILQHQTDSVRRQLNGAITGVATSVDANPNPNPARQVLKVPSQRRQVDVQANTAILTELVKNLELSKVTLRKETPLIQIIDTPILPLTVDKPGKVASVLGGSFLFAFLTGLYLFIRMAIRNNKFR